MSKPKRIALIVAASLAGLAVLLIVASLIIVQTNWFANYVREKIVASIEESTGGTVELKSFQFDPWHLTVRIRDFVLHGTEPANAHPLARVSLLEVHLKLFSGIMHTVDLAYVGIEQPQVNLIVFPDGKTNVPEPKIPKKPSDSNSLQTIVDLKIGEFRIDNGLLEYSQQKTAFSGQGRNLHALLNYNTVSPSYSGNLVIQPLVFAQGSRPPIEVGVNLPVTIDSNSIKLANATLATSQSKVLVNATLTNINNPVIDAKVNADVGLPEWARSFNLPIDTASKNVPHELTAELAAHIDQKANVMTLQTAHLALGRTTFQASGTLQDPNHPNAAAEFNGNLATDELGRLLKVTAVQAHGDVTLNGTAKLDAQNNYQVNGTLNSRDLSIRQATTRISNVNLYAPFHADPYLISIDGLKLDAFGGSLAAKIFLERMQQLSVEGTLQHFSLPVLAETFTGNKLGYDGSVGGSIKARGDLNAKGTTGYSANANLTIVPGDHGVPVNGHINAAYVGATGDVTLQNSYVALPNSRVDLAGTLDKQLNVNLVSHNLNDFLPAANFGAKQPMTALPVTLQPGGTATVDAAITGNVAAPNITGNVALRKFSAQKATFDQLSLDVAANPTNASVRNGVLSSRSLQTNFDASIGLRKWSPLPSSPVNVNLTMRNANVADLLSLAGQTSVPVSGTAAADVHVNGTYGDPLGNAQLEVDNGTAYNEPFNQVLARVNLAHDLITIDPLQLNTNAGAVTVRGTYTHPSDSFLTGEAAVHVTSDTLQLAKLATVQQRSPGTGGTLNIAADASLRLYQNKNQTAVDVENVNADVNGKGLRYNNQDAGDLTLTARTVNRDVQYKLNSNFAGSSVNVAGTTSLNPDYATTADLNIQNLNIERVLAIAGQGAIPASGTFSASGHVAGSTKAQNANLQIALANANVYREKVDRLSANVTYSPTLVRVDGLQLRAPAGSVDGTAEFRHPENDFKSGSADLNIQTSDINLSRIAHLHQSQPTLQGSVRAMLDVAADLRQKNGKPDVALHRVNADVSTRDISLQNRALGDARLTAATHGQTVDFKLDSDIAKSQIHGSGNAQLTGDYPATAKLTFQNIRYSNIASYLTAEPANPPQMEALVEGQASVSGPLLDIDRLNGRLQLDKLQATASAGASPTGSPARRRVAIDNQGPIVVSLNKSTLNIESFHLAGPGTKVDVTGTASIAGGPLDARADANVDLDILQAINKNFYSSGALTLDAAVHGTLVNPLVNGRIDLKNANVNYADAPNGLSNANGTILLSGNGASIQTLTGESGGGKISVTGFAGLSGQSVAVNVKAIAKHVRVRYSGISATSDATITLTGSTSRSVLGGNVTVTRIAYNSSSDTGSILSSFASTPPSTPSAPSPILAGLHLDLHVNTAPDLRVVTTYANRLAVQANLTIRGTAVNPGMLGRVIITDGQLVFFGNTYTVNTGTINFYNPNTIQPIINFGMQTLAQGVNVTLNVQGPMDNLQLSYTSDPPLTFEQIVQLLASNTTPNDANVAGNAPPQPQESFTQMGESAILGQAVANPLSSRVQRVFGLSQFKIDPSFGQSGQTGAKVTLQQKIANNITFTYIQDTSVPNSEIVRVQWDLTPQLSAMAMRDYNANVSVQLFYKFKKR